MRPSEGRMEMSFVASSSASSVQSVSSVLSVSSVSSVSYVLSWLKAEAPAALALAIDSGAGRRL